LIGAFCTLRARYPLTRSNCAGHQSLGFDGRRLASCRSRFHAGVAGGFTKQPGRHAECRFEMPAEVRAAAIAPGIGNLCEGAMGLAVVAQVLGATGQAPLPLGYMVSLQASDCSYLMDPLNEALHFDSTCCLALSRFIWAIIDHFCIFGSIACVLAGLVTRHSAGFCPSARPV